MGEKYTKLKEDFESLVHNKDLRAIFNKFDTNQIARVAEFDMHLVNKPKPQEWIKPVGASGYGLSTSHSSGKSKKKALKSAR